MTAGREVYTLVADPAAFPLHVSLALDVAHKTAWRFGPALQQQRLLDVFELKLLYASAHAPLLQF